MNAVIFSLLDLALVLSNLAFLIHAVRSVSQFRWTRAAIFFLIVFASGLYHTCRSYSNLCLFDFRMHHNLDFFFAEITIPLTILSLIYFPPYYQWVERWLIIAFAILVFLVQVYTDGEMLVQLIIVGSAAVILVGYWIWFYSAYKRFPRYNWIMLSRGLTVTMMSVALFAVQSRYMYGYGAVHSIWHTLGALGMDYILRAKPPGTVYAALDSKIRFNNRNTLNFRTIPRI